MAIINRDLDSSQQRVVYSGTVSNTSTGVTYPVCVIGSQSQLLAANMSTLGLSGAPVHTLWVHRFIAGAGFTSIAMGTSVTCVAFGTSGVQTLAVAAAGSSYQLLAGDLVVLATGAANTGTVATVVSLVCKQLQDIQTQYGA